MNQDNVAIVVSVIALVATIFFSYNTKKNEESNTKLRDNELKLQTFNENQKDLKAYAIFLLEVIEKYRENIEEVFYNQGGITTAKLSDIEQFDGIQKTDTTIHFSGLKYKNIVELQNKLKTMDTNLYVVPFHLKLSRIVNESVLDRDNQSIRDIDGTEYFVDDKIFDTRKDLYTYAKIELSKVENEINKFSSIRIDLMPPAK